MLNSSPQSDKITPTRAGGNDMKFTRSVHGAYLYGQHSNQRNNALQTPRAHITAEQHMETLLMLAEDARYQGDDEAAERLERRVAGLLKRRDVREHVIGYESMFTADLASAGNWR